MQTASLATAPRFFGVFVGQSLQGILELYDGEASGHVEVTLVVERPWRNKGLGWAVLGAAMEWVRHSQTRTIRMVFSRDNWPMRALAHKANAQLTLVFDEIYASITVMPNPTYQVGTATDLDVNRNATGEVACARARLHGTTSSCRRQTSARLIAG